MYEYYRGMTHSIHPSWPSLWHGDPKAATKTSTQKGWSRSKPDMPLTLKRGPIVRSQSHPSSNTTRCSILFRNWLYRSVCKYVFGDVNPTAQHEQLFGEMFRIGHMEQYGFRISNGLIHQNLRCIYSPKVLCLCAQRALQLLASLTPLTELFNLSRSGLYSLSDFLYALILIFHKLCQYCILPKRRTKRQDGWWQSQYSWDPALVHSGKFWLSYVNRSVY